jgi:antitoxin MazE
LEVSVQARIAKWGNSLGLRIPKNITTRLGLAEGVEVRIEIEGDRVVISPRRPQYKLKELLVGMTPKAMHDAFDWGPDVGRESVDE